MATLVRKDIAQEPSPWSDVIVWYTVGVNAMMQRPITDPASWWYFAAIHGEDIAGTDQGMPGWRNIIAPPTIVWGSFKPSSPNPVMWDQCQHGTWYFPPWHRGYLMALEAQLQADITANGGPANWALPYWNYWNSQGNLPTEFTQTTLPATTASGAAFPASLGGKPNPLYVAMRYGSVALNGISSGCLSDNVYSGDVGTGFGGGPTPYSHFSGSTGDLENNPHNIVHVDVGATEPAPPNYGGLMSDPEYAALDPIFYLHHGMIDALWAYWNTDASNSNPSDPKWLSPAFPNHPGMFLMPWESAGAGVSWQYLPQNVTSLGALQVKLSNGKTVAYAYTYDFLAAPASATYPFAASPQPTATAKRLLRLGVKPALAAAAPARPPVQGSALLGASTGALSVTNDGAQVPIRLDPATRSKLVASLENAATGQLPDRVVLKLEGVTGTAGASALDVFLSGPNLPKRKIGTAGLFGLKQASKADARHGGSGLSFGFDISDAIDELQLAKQLETGDLSVSLAPRHPIHAGREIKVGRVSVHRLPQ